MNYELYLRMPEGADRLPAATAKSELLAAGFATFETWPAVLDLGQGKLTAEAYRREPAGDPDRLDGLNLGFAMGVDLAQGERAVALAFGLAAKLGAELFDPQLGQVVQASDHDRIARAWRRSWEFQAGVVGTAELGLGSPVPLDQGRSGFPPRLKVLLFLLAAFLVVVFLFRTCLSNWADRQAPAVGLPPVEPGQSR